MEKNNPLTQEVNFIHSVTFLGALTLFAIVIALEASDMENPIANHIATATTYQEL